MDVLLRCDCKMLRYMAGVRWQDGRSSSEVPEMCGVRYKPSSVKLRQGRLKWFRQHVKRAEEGVLGEVREVRVRG